MPDRIAMVSSAYYQADPRLRRQAEALAARGYAVEVLCPSQPDDPVTEVVRGVKVCHLPTRKYRGRSLVRYMLSNADFFIRALITITRNQIQRGYAAVQIYSMPEALVFTALWPRLVHIPVIYDAGDLTRDVYTSRFGNRGGPLVAWLLRAQESLGLRFSNMIITVHDEYRRRLLERGVASEKLHVVMNLPDEQLLRRALAASGSQPRWDDEFVFVHHGSLVPRYGVDLAIRAVALLHARIPRLRLWICGDGDFRPRLGALIDELGVGNFVTLHPGYIPLEQLLPRLATAHAAVVPTRRDDFTDTILPNKLLEYLGLGLPTVVSDTRTVLDHVPPTVVEYCAPDDVHALAQAMERLVADPLYRQGLVANARAFAAEHSWEHEAEAYCAMVDELCSRTRRSIDRDGHSTREVATATRELTARNVAAAAPDVPVRTQTLA